MANKANNKWITITLFIKILNVSYALIAYTNVWKKSRPFVKKIVSPSFWR